MPIQAGLLKPLLSGYFEHHGHIQANKGELTLTFSAEIAPIAPTASDRHCREYLDKHRRAKFRRIGRFNIVGATC